MEVSIIDHGIEFRTPNFGSTLELGDSRREELSQGDLSNVSQASQRCFDDIKIAQAFHLKASEDRHTGNIHKARLALLGALDELETCLQTDINCAEQRLVKRQDVAAHSESIERQLETLEKPEDLQFFADAQTAKDAYNLDQNQLKVKSYLIDIVF